jgi:hypothetical protein
MDAKPPWYDVPAAISPKFMQPENLERRRPLIIRRREIACVCGLCPLILVTRDFAPALVDAVETAR